MNGDSSNLPSGSEGSPDELTQRLIDWLREYFHEKLLISAEEDDPNEMKSSKACAILFTVKLGYLKGYKELWLLNEDGQRGRDRVLTGAQYEELHKRNRLGGPYNPIYVDVKLGRPDGESDRVTWRFEGGEVVGGECGAGYEGTIDYGRVQQSFSWGGPLRETWIS